MGFRPGSDPPRRPYLPLYLPRAQTHQCKLVSVVAAHRCHRCSNNGATRTLVLPPCLLQGDHGPRSRKPAAKCKTMNFEPHGIGGDNNSRDDNYKHIFSLVVFFYSVNSISLNKLRQQHPHGEAASLLLYQLHKVQKRKSARWR